MRFMRRRDAKAWFEQHAEAFAAYDAGQMGVDRYWKRRVQASWGLIARGDEAIPFALEMLRSRNPDIREDGAGVLAALGQEEGVVDELLRALQTETEDQPRDVIIEALGRLKNRRAIPQLAQIIRDSEADGDTRSDAADALGRIVRRRFDQKPDPVRAASHWLDTHGL